MKHTPGPWFTVDHSDGWTIQTKPEGVGYCIAMQYGDSPKENAILLSAAPDLLAAAKAFVEAWDKCLQLEKTDVALRLARAAIAKAEGTPPC